MIEITFQEGAGGGLKQAANCNAQALQCFVQQIDVFCFSLMLSWGSIQETAFFNDRYDLLLHAYAVFPEGIRAAQEQMNECQQQLARLFERLKKQPESLRIWYSDTPDDLCCCCWFLQLLAKWQLPLAALTCIKLPKWKENEDNTQSLLRDWSDINPEDFISYLPLQHKIPFSALPLALEKWKQLQAEDSSLRAVLHGTLQSVPLTFYDSLILSTCKRLPLPVREAFLIGSLLADDQVRMHDTFLHTRILALARHGDLYLKDEGVKKDHPYGSLIYLAKP